MSELDAVDIRFNMATPDDAAAGLAALLTDLIAFIRRFVVVSDHQAVAVALWAAHTHTIDAFECTPYLQVTSATKRAGKTRLLEVLEPLVARPWFTGRTSAAALMRKIDMETPTLLLDESDAAFGGEKDYAEALRGLLNSGYRRSGKATVCVKVKGNYEAKDFRTFGAKAIAGIGKLPDTIADRCIAIALRRRTHDEPCERWRERDGHEQAGVLLDRLVAWALRARHLLRQARPDMPDRLGDRQQDVWEPLISIADLADGDWPITARQAAVALTSRRDDPDFKVELLKDIAEILAGQTEPTISTKDLLAQLVALEGQPWATWRKDDKPLTARGLMVLLDPLDIHPDRHLRVARGYRCDAFTDAISRYLPSYVSMCHKPNETGPEPAFSMCHSATGCDTYETTKTPITTGFVTHGHIEAGICASGSERCCKGGPLQLHCQLCSKSRTYWQREGQPT